MTHDAIRTASNQLMILFEGNIAAPVSGERLPRPDCESQSADANHRAGDLRKRGEGEDLQAHWFVPFLYHEQPPTESYGNAMRHRGGQTLSFHDALGPNGGDRPNDQEDEPASDDDVAGGCSHFYWALASVIFDEVN